MSLSFYPMVDNLLSSFLLAVDVAVVHLIHRTLPTDKER